MALGHAGSEAVNERSTRRGMEARCPVLPPRPGLRCCHPASGHRAIDGKREVQQQREKNAKWGWARVGGKLHVRIICSLPERSKNVLRWVIMNFALLTSTQEREETERVGCHQGNRVGSGSGRLAKSWRESHREGVRCHSAASAHRGCEMGAHLRGRGRGLAGGGIL